nr:hypothetical protein [Tanacetum cinerariifolium]
MSSKKPGSCEKCVKKMATRNVDLEPLAETAKVCNFWSQDEELLLAKCFIQISKDPIIDEYVLSESVTSVPAVAISEAKTSETNPKPSKSVSEDISNEVRESPDAPLVKELVSDDKLEKKTIFPTVAKIEFVRPKQQEKLVRKPIKLQLPSKEKDGNMSYLSDFKEFDGGYVTFGGGAKRGKITDKGTLKTGTKESVGVGHASKEAGSSKDYILMPLWKNGSLLILLQRMLAMMNHKLIVMLERRKMKKIPPKKTPMSKVSINRLIAQGMADALVEYESHRNSNPNGDGSHKSGSRNGRSVRAARECTYKEFLNYQPFNFKANDGVELALMCGRMFPEKSDEVEKYVGGLPDMIQGSVMASKTKTIQAAIELENDLMDQKPGNGEARGKVYALGGGETDQDPNNMEDDIKA